jgi:type II secretory pathway component GspD/PulD (secretin)
MLLATALNVFLAPRAGAEPVRQADTANLPAIETYLKRQLKGVDGVEVMRNPDGLEIVEISGTVVLARDCGKVRKVLADTRNRWGQAVVDNVVYQPDVLKVKETILAGLVSAKVENPIVEISPDVSHIRLAGTVYTEEQATVAVRVTDSQVKKLDLGEVTLVSDLQVATATFEVEVTHFQISENQSRMIGRDLLRQIGDSLRGEGMVTYDKVQPSPTSGTGSDEQTKYNVVAKVNVEGILTLLEANGAATRIERFTVLTQNEQEGRALTADEFIIPVYRELGASPSAIEKIDAGLIVKAKVTIRDPTTVLLKIDCEVSDATRNWGMAEWQAYPILAKRQFVNTVDLPLNRQVILGANEWSHADKAADGTPWLRHVPVLNWFFASRRQEAGTSYAALLVVVRRAGTVISEDPSVSARTEELAKQVRKRFGKAE